MWVLKIEPGCSGRVAASALNLRTSSPALTNLICSKGAGEKAGLVKCLPHKGPGFTPQHSSERLEWGHKVSQRGVAHEDPQQPL